MLGYLAYTASSAALLGFGLDSLLEVGASLVAVWELSGSDDARRAIALLLLGGAYVGLGTYLLAVSLVALVAGDAEFIRRPIRGSVEHSRPPESFDGFANEVEANADPDLGGRPRD
ncbi:hypothetical protein FVP33_01255 [Lacisediminihabitans profunda]|uniref:Uncharacterized protein n=1 Tax=Lacisediminihabitans profunda TaxID=2594790 RepID=A0A5C8UUD6_9MICO|nr:hypothetical protein FVP33_01255 [Lacisediminihabitans profunda]